MSRYPAADAVGAHWQRFYSLKLGSGKRALWIENAAFIAAAFSPDEAVPEPPGFMIAN